jgi:flagellar hook-length control protein FliK
MPIKPQSPVAAESVQSPAPSPPRTDTVPSSATHAPVTPTAAPDSATVLSRASDLPRASDPAALQGASTSPAPQPDAAENNAGDQSPEQDPRHTAPPRPSTPASVHQPAPIAPPAQAAPQAATPAPSLPTTPGIQSAAVKPAGPTPVIGLAQSPGAAKHAALARLTAQAPALKQGIAQASFIPQASKALTMALRQGEGTVTLRLTPESLGTLKVELTLHNAEVTARLHASTESARQLLIDAQSSLRAALEARGLSVERIEVTAPPGADAQDARLNQDHRGTELAGDGRSRQRNADAQQDSPGRAPDEHADAAPDDPWQPPTLTLALDDGGVYRLHLDAVA